jgi:rfaE bifunctional protein kinase chain/domain
MKNTEAKILNDDIVNGLNNISQLKNSIVLVYGHFNVIHPGHLRFLQFAHEKGDQLLVAIRGAHEIEVHQKNNYFSEVERAKGISAIEGVDHVVILNNISLEEVINIVKPNTFILGSEFKNKRHKLVEEYIYLVEKNGGKILFDSGEIKYANTDLLFNSHEEIHFEKLNKFHSVCRKNSIQLPKLREATANFKTQNILVIGDSIVDQYIACDALGMSAEAPVLAIKELETKEFIGGAAIVACHLKTLRTKCHFLSVIGDDESGKFLSRQLNNYQVETKLLIDQNRPTTFKMRYMVNNQKLLRVSRLKDNQINRKLEENIISHVEKIAPQLDSIIISDFVYGVITSYVLNHIIKIAKTYNIRLFGDLQCSSQVGNVSKFKDFDMICPTERETRIALSDQESGLEKLSHDLISKTNTKNTLITLGSDGFIAYHKVNNSTEIKSQHFPALNSNPIDVAGAGDTLLATVTAALSSGMNLIEASVIGSAAAAIATSKVGNQPIQLKELDIFLENLSDQLHRI